MGKGLEVSGSEIKSQYSDIKNRLPHFFDDLKLSADKDIGKSIDDGLKNQKDVEETGNKKNTEVQKNDDVKATRDSGIIHVSDVADNDNPEKNDKTTDFLKKLKDILTSSEEIQEMLTKNPELKTRLGECLDILNNPDRHSLQEINWALDKIKKGIKGAVLEMAVKEALSDVGLAVEETQRTVQGDTGDTRPDVIAMNNTNKTIVLFGKEIKPKNSVFIECKCGRKSYMDTELQKHIPNQLSGHKGISILITTSDMDQVDQNLVENVIEKNSTTAVILDSSAEQVEEMLRGVRIE